MNPRPSILRRYLSVYVALWRNSIIREMGFKTNFLLWIVVEGLWFMLQLGFVGVLYIHTDRIGDWTKWQVVMLIGAGHCIQQVFQAFFLVNCSNLSEMVRTGKMDFMMLMPINTRFLVSLRQVDLGAFVNAASAVGVMAYAGMQLGLSPTFGQMAGAALLGVTAIFIHYALMFLLATASFWTVKAQGIVWGYYNLFNISRLPDSAFRAGWFKNVFTFVLPMILVANVPVKVLIAKLHSPWEPLLLVTMAVVAMVVSEAVWRLSLRRYTSASS